ncbi:putative portal protein [Polaromonas phage Tiera]|nr:putative portal protein [Polaromonas phage Tiera]
MATEKQKPINETAPVKKQSVQAQKNIMRFLAAALTLNKGAMSGFHQKMDEIDIAYSRYKEATRGGRISDGKDVGGSVGCGNVFDKDRVTPPLVISQVDAHVAYLAEVFLSGSPLFPVVSNPMNRQYAEQLESLLDDHASLGGYARQLLLTLHDAVKYNYGPAEVSWDQVDQFSVTADLDSSTGFATNRKPAYYNKIKKLDPRNVFRDMSVDPADAATDGDYIGYIELYSKMRMKRLMNKLSKEGKLYNGDKIMGAMSSVTPAQGNYRGKPVISDYTGSGIKGETNWDSWFGSDSNSDRVSTYGSKYEVVVCYARILPIDFQMSALQPNTPQIWKFTVVNGMYILSIERIVSAYDVLPILIAVPLEDGMGMQTKSVAENGMEFQDAAATLYNIRFVAARRAVNDRALYVSDAIDSKDVNSASPAPKIPVRMSVLSNKTLDQVYKSIPFQTQGLETVMQDATTIVNFSDQLSGLNKPQSGQFQKGNKSVTEWNDTMGGSENRLRLRALLCEHQFFSPLRSIMVLNLFQYGDDAVVVTQKNGEVLTIDMKKLKQQVLAFRTADGFTPKSKLAGTEAIAALIQLIGTSQILQQTYGASLPGMVAHLAQLQGIRGLEQYDPKYAVPQPDPMAPLQAQGVPAQQAPAGVAMQGMPGATPIVQQQQAPVAPAAMTP